MASSQDTEITLGTGKLLVLFFGLVAICALFFALGYSLGHTSEPGISTANAAPPQTMPGRTKPTSNTSTAPPMTFYKAVEQKDASPELTPPSPDSKTEATPNSAPAGQAQSPASNAADSITTLPTA